jgi:hypothetical protein
MLRAGESRAPALLLAELGCCHVAGVITNDVEVGALEVVASASGYTTGMAKIGRNEIGGRKAVRSPSDTRVFARCGLGLGLCAAFWTVPVCAQAILDFALEVDAPADAHCSDAAALERAIEERVGHLVFLGQSNPARRLQLVIARDPARGAWNARIAMRDPRSELLGERQLSVTAADCAELDEALIVVITTLIGVADQTPPASAARARPPARPASPEPQPPPPSPALPAVTHQADAQSDASAVALVAAAAVRLDIGLLPQPSIGPAAVFEVDFGAFGLLFAAAFLPQAARDLGNGAQASFMSVLGELSVCARAARPLGATLQFCAGAETDLLAVSTSGLGTDASSRAGLVRGLIRTRLRAPIGPRFGVLVDLATAFPVFSARFYFVEEDGTREYYHAVRLGVFTQLGMYWVFSS